MKKKGVLTVKLSNQSIIESKVSTELQYSGYHNPMIMYNLPTFTKLPNDINGEQQILELNIQKNQRLRTHEP